MIAIGMSAIAAAKHDPRNPTCPEQPNWGSTQPRQFSAEQLGVSLDAPAPWGGIWGIRASTERQPFDIPDLPRADRTAAGVTKVTLDGGALGSLNELECADDIVYAHDVEKSSPGGLKTVGDVLNYETAESYERQTGE